MSSERGFTLLEVLVALVIVAMGMAAVIEAVNSSAGNVSYLRDKTFATWVALNQIATVRLAPQVPTPGKSNGDVDFAGRKWHWYQQVNNTQLPGMLKIDVSVRPVDAGGDKLDDDSGTWYATLSGFWGDAVASPRGDLDWGSQSLMPQTPGAPGSGTGAPGTPAAPGTPGPGMTPGGFTPQPGSPGAPGALIPQPTPPPPPVPQ